jgi:hypothetical protein
MIHRGNALSQGSDAHIFKSKEMARLLTESCEDCRQWILKTLFCKKEPCPPQKIGPNQGHKRSPASWQPRLKAARPEKNSTQSSCEVSGHFKEAVATTNHTNTRGRPSWTIAATEGHGRTMFLNCGTP